MAMVSLIVDEHLNMGFFSRTVGLRDDEKWDSAFQHSHTKMPESKLSYRTWWPNLFIFNAAADLLVVRGSFSIPLQGVAICVVVFTSGTMYSFLIKPRIAKGDEVQTTRLQFTKYGLLDSLRILKSKTRSLFADYFG